LFDNGRSATQGGFNAIGAPLPDITAVIVTFLELIGGLALVLGVLTPIVGALLTIDMLGAFFFTHMGNGFFVPTGGYELVLLLGGGAFALVLTGPGMFALDSLINLPRTARSGSSVRQPQRG
jgi:putative oxidoreductase